MSALESLRTSVTELEEAVQRVGAERLVLQGTGLLALQAAMPQFLGAHSSGILMIRELCGTMRAALHQPAVHLLPSLNERILVRSCEPMSWWDPSWNYRDLRYLWVSTGRP
jgi:hypothetical protein